MLDVPTPHSTSFTCEVALVTRVPVADVATVGVSVVACVGGVGGQALTQTAGLQTVGAPAVAICLSEVGTVSKFVIAGVGGCRGQSRAQAAAPPAVPGDGLLVAAGGGQGGTVGPLVLTGSHGGERAVCRSLDWSTGESDHSGAHSTHPHTSPQSDVTVLPPARTPGVLDQPVLLPLLLTVAHHSDGMVGRVVSAPSEYSPAVVLTQ